MKFKVYDKIDRIFIPDAWINEHGEVQVHGKKNFSRYLVRYGANDLYEGDVVAYGDNYERLGYLRYSSHVAAFVILPLSINANFDDFELLANHLHHIRVVGNSNEEKWWSL